MAGGTFCVNLDIRVRGFCVAVHNSWPILERVRTFAHILARTSKGFASLGKSWPKLRKGSYFCADSGQNLERVRTFAQVLAKTSKGFALLRISWVGRERVRIFGAQTASSKNLQNEPVIFVAFCLHNFIIRSQLFGRLWLVALFV